MLLFILARRPNLLVKKLNKARVEIDNAHPTGIPISYEHHQFGV